MGKFLATLIAVRLVFVPAAGVARCSPVPPDPRDPSIEARVNELGNADPDVRQAAAEALAQIAKAHPVDVVARLESIVRASPNSLSRRAAIMTLGFIGEPGRSALPAVIRAIEDTDPSVRANALGALAQFGGADPKTVLPGILKALGDRKVLVRANATMALAINAPDAPETVRALVSATKDPDPFVRANAVGALGNTGPRAKGVIPDIVAALQDKDERVRYNAVLLLGTLGAHAKVAAPKLANLSVKDSSRTVRESAVRSLEAISRAQPQESGEK
jgi:HEAT repeat protein